MPTQPQQGALHRDYRLRRAGQRICVDLEAQGANHGVAGFRVAVSTLCQVFRLGSNARQSSDCRVLNAISAACAACELLCNLKIAAGRRKSEDLEQRT